MDTWSRMARRTCSDCGSGLVGWTSAVHLLLVLDDLDARKRVTEIVNLVGGDADAWQCHHCKCWGIFGPTEFVV